MYKFVECVYQKRTFMRFAHQSLKGRRYDAVAASSDMEFLYSDSN